MASQKVTTTVDRFGGFSDRAVPVKATRIESPDVVNVDFSERVAKRRNGYTRLHNNRFGDAALRLMPRWDTGTFDGPYGRIKTRSFMYPGTGTIAWYIGVGVVLAKMPNPAQTVMYVASKGYGSGANLHWSIVYDSSIQNGASQIVGGWRAIFNGTGDAASLEVADGQNSSTAYETAVGRYRFLELTIDDATKKLGFYVYDAAGTLVGSALDGAVWAGTDYTGGGTSEDITIGVGMDTSNTINSKYFAGTIAELRLAVGTSSKHAYMQGLYASRWSKEIPDNLIASAQSGGGLFGYYRLNDANANGRLYDLTSNANHGSLPFSPPTWAFDESEVVGSSGLEWRPDQLAYVRLVNTGANPSFNTVFAGTTTGATPTSGQRWTVRGVCVPKLPPGATAAPRGVILWSGISTNPQPVAIGVNLDGSNADKFQAIYMDNATERKMTITSVNVSALAGKKVRFSLDRRTVYSTTGTINQVIFQIAYETGVGTQVAIATATPITCTGTVTTCDSSWYIGARLSATGVQSNGTVGVIDTTRGSFCGIIDDVQLIWNGTSQGPQYVGIGSDNPSNAGYILNEVSSWTFSNPSFQTVFYLKFNDGYGNNPFVETTTSNTYTCDMFPAQLEGYRWDAGIVEPYNIVRPRGLWDYKTFRANGSTERRILAVAGSGLYEIPVGGGVAKLVASGFFKSTGKVSFAQYGNNVIMAEPNGQRPMIYDGNSLRFAGISAPTAQVSASASTTGGTLAAGTYWVYYTFVNTVTGDESNPSPGVSVTTTGTTGAINTVGMMTSPDPQVNARRIYITGVNGTDGAVAYLVTTVNDNTTINYGDATNKAITAVPTGTTLEYFANHEAPQASVVGVFRDGTFLGGNSLFPTRLYRSAIGYPTRYDPISLYLDLDLDSGDPITHMIRTNNYLLVSMRDGTARVYTTGDTNAPFAFDFLPIKHGAVGAQAAAYSESTIFYMADDDCFQTDGQNEQNITSPDNPLYPSIQYTMREGLNDALKDGVSVAVYHPRNQVWFCVAATGATSNSMVLVYDSSQGIWTKYLLPIDTILQSENENDATRLIGAVNGYVSTLDTGSYDGVTSLVSSTVTAGTTTSVTISGVHSVANGLTLHLFNFASESVVSATVESATNDGTNTTIKVYSSFGLTPAAGDRVVVGGIPWYMDLVFDWGNPGRKKRLRWVKVAGVSDNDGNFIRCSTFRDKPGRSFSFVNARESWIQFRTEDAYRIMMVGGEARSARIRLTETSNPLLLSPTPLPSTAGTIQVLQVEGVAEILDIE